MASSLLLLVALAAFGVGIAPAVASDDGDEENNTIVINANESGSIDASLEGAQTADVDLRLTVEEEVKAPSGTKVSIDLNIDPVQEEELQIDWFEVRLEFDNSKLAFNNLEGSQVGGVDVTGVGADYVEFENGYELGDFFIDPAEAPLTLATVEFAVFGDSGEAYVRPDPDNTVTGWGFGWTSISEHTLWYEGGYIDILDASDLGTVEGTVTNEEGDPVEGVQIGVANAPGSAETDADGEYKLFVPEGPAMLQAAHPDELVNVTETAVVETGSTTQQNLTLKPYDRGDADVTLTAADHRAGAGETIEVPFYAFDRGWSQEGYSDGVRGMGAQIEYDPEVLEFVDASGGVENLGKVEQVEDNIVYLEGQSAQEFFFDSPPWEDMSPYHMGTVQFRVVGSDGDTSPVNIVYDESAIAYASPDDGGPYWPGSEALGNPAGEVVVAGEADVGTATVEGTVTDQDGNPVAGADVYLANDDGAGATQTNGDGTYELEVTGFENSDHVIAFDGGPAYEAVVEKEITAADGDTVSVDAQLQAADASIHVDVQIDDNVAQNERITIPVHVTEGAAGVPDDAENGALGYNFLFDYDPEVIEFVGAESIAFEQTESDNDDAIIDDGDPDVSPDYGELRVLSMDPSDSAFPPFTAVNVTFDVIGDAGDNTTLEIVPTTDDGQELSGVSHDPAFGAWPAIWDQGEITVGDDQVSNDRGTVKGTVTDTDGNPIEGATVEANSITATTSSDGSYEFEVSEGTYDMTAAADGYNSATVEIDVTKDQTTQQNVELEERDVWIEINATDAAGGEGAMVTVPIEVNELSADWQDVADAIVGYELFFDYDTDVLKFASAEGGAFTVQGVRTDIPQSDPGYGLGELRLNSSDPFETAEPPLTAVEVTFELVGDPGDNSTVEIIPVNDAGESVSGISHDPNFGAWPAIYKPGTVEITDEDVSFGTLELAVTDQDGNPVQGAAVTGGGVEETTDGDGSISVEVQAGSYDLTVQAEGESATKTVEVTGDSTTRESIELPIGGDDGDDGEDDDGSEEAPETGLTFEAVNSGGLVSFNQPDRHAAEEEGVKFPAEDISIEGAIDEETGTWESTNVHFEEFTAQGLSVQVTAPDGLHGEFDAENDEMTFEGELVVSLEGQAEIVFTLSATTGRSGAIEGEGNIGDEDGSVMFVENEFTVPESGNPVIDGALGLPADEPGTNWFVMPLDFTLEEVEVDDGSDGGGGGSGGSGTGTLQGEILTKNGDPVENAVISVDGQFQEKLTDRNGEFEVTLPAGTYTVEVEADGYESETFQVEVVGGETMPVSGVLEGGEASIQTSVSTTQMDDGSVMVEGTVENVGGAPATEQVELSFGGESTTETVEVGPGESRSVSAEFSVDDPSGTQAEVSAGEDTATTTFSATGQDDGSDADDGGDGGKAGNATILRGVGQGGFIAFAQDTDEATARSEGLLFPSQAQNDSYIEFRAVVDEEAGTWEATDFSFPILNVNDNLAASVEAPNGLSGEIDPETGRMTMSGTFRVTVLDRPGMEPNPSADPFEFEMNLVSGSSGSMTGSATFDGNNGSVELVDNQYIIDDTTDNPLIDGSIGLPSTDSGTNWLKLDFDVEIEEGADPDEGGDLGGEDDTTPEESEEEGATFLAAFGQLLGLVGVASALILVIYGFATRLAAAVDPDPGA